MNPLTNTRKINELNDREVQLNIPEHKSWHAQYSESAWIFIGGLPFELSEGDVICIFSQYGEPVNINFIRDKKTGKFRGYCFLCYEDQRSTVLAVDNFNGTKICGRTVRVDHVANYKPPKEGTDDEIAKMLAEKGCGPEVARDLERIASSKKDDDGEKRQRDRSPLVENERDERRSRRDRSERERSPRNRSGRDRVDKPRDLKNRPERERSPKNHREDGSRGRR